MCSGHHSVRHSPAQHAPLTANRICSRAGSRPPSIAPNPPTHDVKCRRMFDFLRRNAEGVDGEVESSLKPATRAQTGGQDQGHPSPGASRWARASSQGAKKGGNKEISPATMQRRRSAYLKAHIPSMKRSTGGRPALGDVSVEDVTCAHRSRRMSRGWVGLQAATAQGGARRSLPLRRWRCWRRALAQAVGDGGHPAARRAPLGEPFS